MTDHKSCGAQRRLHQETEKLQATPAGDIIIIIIIIIFMAVVVVVAAAAAAAANAVAVSAAQSRLGQGVPCVVVETSRKLVVVVVLVPILPPDPRRQNSVARFGDFDLHGSFGSSSGRGFHPSKRPRR